MNDKTQTAEAKYEAFMKRYAMRKQIGGTAHAWKVGKERAEAELREAKAAR